MNYDAKREEREEQEAARRAAREEQEIRHSEEAHAAEMAEMAKRLAKSDEALQGAVGVLLVSLAKLTGTADEFLRVKLTQEEFGSPGSMRAAACGLIKQAAEMEGSSEALRQAADKILEVSANVPSAKKAA